MTGCAGTGAACDGARSVLGFRRRRRHGVRHRGGRDARRDGPHRLVELVGDDAVAERGGHIVVTARDQAAMIGVLHRLNDLGLDIARIERT